MDTTAFAEAARVTVGCVLLASGVLKLGRTAPADLVALGVPRRAAPAVAGAVPVAEVVVAGCVLLVDGAWPAALALVLFVAFTAVVVRALSRGALVPCRCFGSLARRPVSWSTAARNLFFVALAALALVAGGTGAAPSWPALAILLAASLALILAF